MDWPRIRKRTPLSKIKKIHVAIWDYVIEHGYKPNTPYQHDCVLCEYADRKRPCDEPNRCFYCPAAWPGSNCFGYYDNYSKLSLFWLWKYTDDPKEKRKIAIQIRDIPFKFEKEAEDNGGSEDAKPISE